MKISLNQAAKQVKVAKSTLSRALKDGDLSGTKTEKGQWQIDISELSRWNSIRVPKPRTTSLEVELESPSGTDEKPLETSPFEAEIRLLRERLDDKDDTIRDLRERLDGESAERKRLTTLLTDQQNGSVQKKGFFQRVFSSRG